MADLKEVKSRIRIKRGPKNKMSGVTLPKGTPFYNETDNTLLISDGVTELDKHPIITTNSIHTDNWTVEEINDTVRGLNALKIQKNNNVPIYIINDGGGYPADATVISPEYLRANEVVIGSKSLSINQDNKLCIDGTPIVIKKELYKNDNGSTQATLIENLNIGDKIEVAYSIQKRNNPSQELQKGEKAYGVTTFSIISITKNDVLKNEHLIVQESSFTSSLGITSIINHHLSFNISVVESTDSISKIGLATGDVGLYVKETWGKHTTTSDDYLTFVPMKKADNTIIDDADVKIYKVTKIIE